MDNGWTDEVSLIYENNNIVQKKTFIIIFKNKRSTHYMYIYIPINIKRCQNEILRKDDISNYYER